ncbi:hypothetical protein [Thermoflexus hugenholtzii]
MFEDIRQQLSEVPEGEVIEESVEERSVFPGLAFLRTLSPSQRMILLGMLLIDLFLLGFLILLIAGLLRLG